jgi:hypothetical protein
MECPEMEPGALTSQKINNPDFNRSDRTICTMFTNTMIFDQRDRSSELNFSPSYQRTAPCRKTDTRQIRLASFWQLADRQKAAGNEGH